MESLSTDTSLIDCIDVLICAYFTVPCNVSTAKYNTKWGSGASLSQEPGVLSGPVSLLDKTPSSETSYGAKMMEETLQLWVPSNIAASLRTAHFCNSQKPL